MLNKPELLATAGSIDELKKVAEAGADAVVIGGQTYGVRLPGDFSLEDTAEAVKITHERGMKIYVSANNIMTNDLLAGLPVYLAGVKEAGADAVVFGDPAVIIAMREAGAVLPLHWNAEMTSTNYATANYWARKGATRFVTARELNLEEIAEIKRNTAMEVQVQIHGMTNIYHSKRSLLSNYMVHQGRENDPSELSSEKGLYLIEEERQEEQFPVYEDRNGTHIMSSEDLCMLENLHELMEAGVDSLKIDGLLKSPEYNAEVVRLYRLAIDAYLRNPEDWFQPEWLEAIEKIQPDKRPLSFGFFYKEQVY